MNKGTAIIGMLIAFAVGYFFRGYAAPKGGGDSDPTVAAAGAQNKAPADGIERFRVPLEGPSKGAATPKVSIVEFSDFQCPFCSRVGGTLEQILKSYPNEVRLYFRHNPLPFHDKAGLAAQAAMAADSQGKFWQMHDKMFANQQNLTKDDLLKYGQEIGLDMARFKKDLDTEAFKTRVNSDVSLANQIGVQGTPNFFINGRPIRGAMPFDEFKKVIDDEIQRANKMIARGTPITQVYPQLMRDAKSAPTPAAAAAPQKGPGAGEEVYKLAVGDAATKGGKQPKVTIIEFSDFQCPFCSRVGATLKKIEETYGNDVEVAFKHNPLPFHNNALPAALAAVAAQEQGKFWQMHDKLFANQDKLDRATLEKFAEELGLNVAKFKAAMDSDKAKERVKADQEEANKFGARGTPNFFINGRNFRGAQPFESFKSVIDEEIRKADEKLKSGVPRKNLYAELTKNGLDKAAAPPPTPPSAGEPDGNTAYKADVAGAPVKGAKDALITIVQFSDYQCPFCSRVEPTITKVMDEYKGKVRVAWRDLPLPFHQNAMPAALAARAAGEQGKFWEMHDKLFTNQQNLDRASLDKYAEELGLNMAKFKAAMESEKNKKAIEADAAMGAKIGARGTPAFFINGKFLSGAQPFEAFKSKIDEELKHAQDLIGKGTPKAKVYEAIMKTAKTELAAAPSQPSPSQPAAEQGPENDKTIFKVEPGKSASKGPKNAPLTVVIFSDFQCPFCKRVEPALTQLEKEFAGKVRTVWKNYPLPFHQNAGPAAEASLAAGAQGKFWQMHDKLFENQTTLDRPSLEKYAQEIGLNVAKFKADMDSGKFKADVEAETKEGSAVGVNGTPAVFINGRKIGGAYPYETFKKIADQELAKKK